MSSIARYGTWPSPITAASVAAGSRRLGSVAIDTGDVYWLEARPAEGGRTALMRQDAGGAIAQLTPPATNVRTRVHEYGGGAYAVVGGRVVFSEFADSRLYICEAEGPPRALTPEGAWRYADADLHRSGEWLVCVREDHSQAGHEPANTIVRLGLSGETSAGQVIVSGSDFYANPRLSPDGSRLLWLAWRHPQMPWDGTELWAADLDPVGHVAHARLVAGGTEESIFQPGWSPDGRIYFVSDRTGWWNLYRVTPAGVEPVCPLEAEFGRPLWQFDMKTWAFAGHRLVAAHRVAGHWRLGVVDEDAHQIAPLAASLEPGSSLAADAANVVCVSKSPLMPDSVVRIDPATGEHRTIRRASDAAVDRRCVSEPRAIAFPTVDGATAYAYYYAPQNADVAAPEGERPPLIVVSHGGPTTAAASQFDLEIQFWTSRGFAIVDVDYGGSTGYGRAYRERLRGRWGEVDVDDCVSAARALVDRGLADGARLIIRGGSAGGFTTLAALTFRPGVFAAGASYYGVSDLEALARDTHKFEARYLDSLVGPYPEARDVYLARSPIYAVDSLASAMILLQGLEDRVVPPDQARLMADAVRAKGLPVALLLFDGEQHGFRKAETIVRSLEAELTFYGAVFGFAPADTLPPLRIDNLPAT